MFYNKDHNFSTDKGPKGYNLRCQQFTFKVNGVLRVFACTY